MTKKTKQIIACLACAVFVIGLSLFFMGNGQDVPATEPEEDIVDTENEMEEQPDKLEISVPAVKGAEVIQEEEEEVQAPEVIVTTNEDGDTVQTPNWQAQRELKEDTDLTDESTTPEYKEVHPNNNNNSPSGGDQSTIDGDEYIYVEGFGWVKYGGENIIIEDRSNLELSGNKVGY